MRGGGAGLQRLLCTEVPITALSELGEVTLCMCPPGGSAVPEERMGLAEVPVKLLLSHCKTKPPSAGPSFHPPQKNLLPAFGQILQGELSKQKR